MGGTRSTYEEEERCIQGLVGKSAGTRPLRSPRRRWEDNIKMGFQEVVWWGMDWTDLVQIMERWRSVVNAVMNLRVS